ncbi:hypothetical protein CR513_49729, partial [Mucuna pruriens]
MQIGLLANTVSQLQSARSSNLPLQTIPNLRGNASAHTLRSGKKFPQPAPQQKDVEFKFDLPCIEAFQELKSRLTLINSFLVLTLGHSSQGHSVFEVRDAGKNFSRKVRFMSPQ